MPSTPPLSPSSSRDAARQLERSERVLGSPENRRIPSTSTTPSYPLNLPPLPLTSVNLNGQSYCLSLDLAAQVNAIPQLPIPRQHRQLHQHGINPPAPIPSTSFAPPPIISSSTASAHPPYRQTLDSNQLAALQAALPPLTSRPRALQFSVSNKICLFLISILIF
jgi:hypothetical protein